MGTETFTAFKSDGTAYKLKGRILRHLDNDPVTDADKSNIRTTLGITSQGGLGDLLAANNLSDVSNAATSRTNLSVNSIAEDAEANGTKLLGPSVYFDGTNDVVTVADDSRFTFSDGSDDLPFTISGWVNVASNVKNFTLFAAWDSFREFVSYIDTNGKVTLGLSDGTNDTYALGSTVIPTDQWTHVSIRYSGAGPNSANGFNANQNGTTIFVNGVAETVTPINSASYGGLVNRVQVHTIGSSGTSFAKGHIRNVQIFNRELTASEVADLAKGNELGYSDEFGGALGGTYTSDFTSDSVDGFTASDGAVNATSTVDSDSDNIKYTVDNTSSTDHYIFKSSVFTVGKRYRVELEYDANASNDVVDGFRVTTGGSNQAINVNGAVTGAWTKVSGEVVANGTAIYIQVQDGGSLNVSDAGGDDNIAFRNIKVTQLGTLAEFRSERFDSSTNKWYDLSDNAFVGTNSGATLVGREVPVYETGTWTPSLEFGGGTTGLTYAAQEGHYTRNGNQVTIHGFITLSQKGLSTGNARITGLPFTSDATTNQLQSGATGYGSGLVGLTSIPTMTVVDNDTDLSLHDWGATGAANLDHSNFTDTSNLRFSLTYQIQ
jgi:hypothetical protein